MEQMKFIKQSELNKKKWDSLVLENNGKCYHYSYYLEENSKFWGIYVDENYSKGVVISYNQVFGLKILYPAIFGKYTLFYNCNSQEINEISSRLQKEFKIGTLFSPSEINSLKREERKTQIFEGLTSFNTQAKRMIKKGKENQITIQETDFTQILPIVNEEIFTKIKSIPGESYYVLEKLLSSLNEQNILISKGIYKDNQLQGGLFFCETNDEIFYIIGACQEEARNLGGMYLTFDEIIAHSFKTKKNIDFGGSNIENIRRFYLALGGIDQHYFEYKWNNAPIWFKLIRNFSKLVKR